MLKGALPSAPLVKPNFHVISGGPGVGKTTLLHALRGRGELCVDENARAVIREEVARGGQAVPWIDADAFARAMAERDIQAFDAVAGETRRVFFDRGIMDAYRANGTTPSVELIQALRTRRYNRTVFVAPPWRKIYQVDAERRQDWDEAERTFERILANLQELDYAAVVLPKASVAERVEFVMQLTNPSPLAGEGGGRSPTDEGSKTTSASKAAPPSREF